MEYKIYCAVFLPIYFSKIEVHGQILNFSTEKAFSHYLPVNNEYHHPSWKSEKTLTSLSNLAVSGVENKFDNNYFQNINTQTLRPNHYRSIPNTKTVKVSRSVYNQNEWFPSESHSFGFETNNFESRPWTDLIPESYPWDNEPHTYVSSKNHHNGFAEQNSHSKNTNAWNKVEKVPIVAYNVFEDGSSWNDDSPKKTSYSTSTSYVDNEYNKKPTHPSVSYGPISHPTVSYEPISHPTVSYGPISHPTPIPDFCPKLPVQDSTNDPITIGFGDLEQFPANYTFPYKKQVTLDFVNGQCNIYSPNEPVEYLNFTTRPQKLKCLDEGSQKIKTRLFSTPLYRAPLNEEFEFELQRRELIRPRKLLKPLHEQLNIIGKIYNFIETLDKDQSVSEISNKPLYHKTEAAPLVILNQRFDIREPDSSEKIVLDAFYNFGIPSTEVKFDDLQSDFEENWEAALNEGGYIEDNFGTVDEELESTVSEDILQDIKTIEVNLKETATVALNLLYSPKGFLQNYTYVDEMCLMPTLDSTQSFYKSHKSVDSLNLRPQPSVISFGMPFQYSRTVRQAPAQTSETFSTAGPPLGSASPTGSAPPTGSTSPSFSAPSPVITPEMNSTPLPPTTNNQLQSRSNVISARSPTTGPAGQVVHQGTVFEMNAFKLPKTRLPRDINARRAGFRSRLG